MKQWTLLLAILVTASAFDVPATTGLAQATGSLSGTVVDAQGAVLSGVRVDATLESDPTVKGSTVTDSRGRFTILNLPVGTYRVEYAVEGFATGQRRGVMVSTGESNPLRLVLAGGRLEGPGGAAPGERGPTAAPAAEPKPPGQRAKPPAQAAPALPAPPVTPVTPSASPSPAPTANDTSTSGEVATIPVFYATDRERLPGPSPAYGGNRNSTGQLDLGRFDVTVPRDHRMGSVERPGLWTIWQEDPTKHFVIKTRLLQSYDDFYSGIRELVGRSSRKEAFVFIHGFNVDFDDAVYRTAQLAYDLGFDGAPILYSWPSVGKATPIGYTTDAANNDCAPRQFWVFAP